MARLGAAMVACLTLFVAMAATAGPVEFIGAVTDQRARLVIKAPRVLPFANDQIGRGLILTFGPRDLWEDVHALIRARDERNFAHAEACALDLCRRADGRLAPDTHGRTLVGAVLVQGHERILGVLLWFFVAGPAGALFYRSVRELPALAARGTASRAMQRTAEYVHGLAAWIPARLSVLVYALVGATRAAIGAWPSARATTHASASASWRLLAAVGRGALGLTSANADTRYGRGLDDTLLEALGLIWRTLLVVLAILALLTIFGVLR